MLAFKSRGPRFESPLLQTSTSTSSSSSVATPSSLPSPPHPTHQVGVAHTKSGKNHFSSKIGHKMAPPGFFKIFLNKGIPGYGNAIVTFRSQMSSLVLNSFLSKATLRQRFPIRLSGNSTPLMDWFQSKVTFSGTFQGVVQRPAFQSGSRFPTPGTGTKLFLYLYLRYRYILRNVPVPSVGKRYPIKRDAFLENTWPKGVASVNITSRWGNVSRSPLGNL